MSPSVAAPLLSPATPSPQSNRWLVSGRLASVYKEAALLAVSGLPWSGPGWGASKDSPVGMRKGSERSKMSSFPPW